MDNLFFISSNSSETLLSISLGIFDFIFSDNVAMCIFTLRSSFVYKDIQNTDLATVTAIIKKINNQWKFSWMHRSSGDSDLSIWDLYAHTLNGNKKD